jgi:class 3 adenylate cyclase/S1-C subfamily serine protease
MITCPGCGHDVPARAFCANCGAALTSARRAESRRAEERRTVTTLFCDLVGFTALSERNDPEVVNAFLGRYYDVSRRVVESYGGTVEKFIGDAVVAVFGVPAVHEDDPERAVRAGLRLVDEVDALAGVSGRDVEVRVGVNTGEALVRLDVDPASGKGFLTGDAVNVAARLQSAAPPMAVAVGEATHAATEKVFAFDACHPVALKGKSKPLQAWIATAPLARHGSELRSFTSSFVGREDELAALDGLLDAATAGGSPRFALICGEPGIGKSRLLAEFARRLDDRPGLVTWRQGRCLPFGSGVTFWALSEIVRTSAGVLESDGVARSEARLETVLPEGADRDQLRARLRPLLGLEAEEASREENFAAWREFLEGLAASEPAVLVIEDLHWADEAMLAFMDYLAQSTARVPLLLLATARTEVLELDGPGAGFVAAATQVALGPLSGEETAELARNCLGAKSLPTDLHALILERSGGNPLFAEELVRLLQDRGLLETRGGKVGLKPGVEVPMPDSIGALIAARLDLLAPDRKALLADAAVVGRSFWAGAVAAVGPHDPAQVFEGLHELVAKELVRPERGSSMEGETEFLFVHALVCDVAYAQLTLADRAAKHVRLARWLEERTAGRTQDLAEVLAFHYGTALDMANSCGLFDLEDELAEPTARYLELAGGRAAPLDAAAAAAHFARAERVADEAAKPKRRWGLSRRTRRRLRRRAPLLLAAGAVIAVAVVAGLAIREFRPHAAAAGPVKMTPTQIADKFGAGVVKLTVRVPWAVVNTKTINASDWTSGRLAALRQGKLTWKTMVGSGFVIDKNGTIVTNYHVMYRGSPVSGQDVYTAFPPLWAKVEMWDRQGGYHRARGFCLCVDPFAGTGIITVDPRQLPLVALPVGDAAAVRDGDVVVSLARQAVDLQREIGQVTATARDKNASTGDEEIAGWRVERSGESSTTVLASASPPPQPVGGPVFNESGRVVGLRGQVPLSLSGQRQDNVLGINQVLGAVRWYVPQSWGQKVWDGSWEWWTTSEQARAMGYGRSGELVQLVAPGTAAARAGLRGGATAYGLMAFEHPFLVLAGGDLIVAVDGRPIASDAQFLKLVGVHKPGETVTYSILRDGQSLTVKVKLQAYPYVPLGESTGAGQ